MTIQARARNDERGSIPIMMTVLTVATALVITMMLSIDVGLRQSRRSGDSADAVQVADAGINEAVQQLSFVAGSSFTRSGTVGSSNYSYMATKDADGKTWHINALGTNASGVKRRVYADAVGESQFVSPIYINDAVILGAGAALDSYRSGVNPQQGCTRKGYVSVSDGTNVKFTSGGQGTAVVNCTKPSIDSGWSYSMDGCTVYGGTNLPPMGQGACPPAPYTSRIATPFPLQKINAPTSGVTYPSSGSLPGSSFSCNSTSGASSLRGGATYYYTTINLQPGCGIDPSSTSADPVRMFAKDIVIGGQGAQAKVNEPTTGLCSTNTTGWSYLDQKNNPALYYCPSWPSSVQLFVPNGIGGTVTFQGSGTKVWALLAAPDAAVTLKSPQLEMWGAMVAGSVNVQSQFSWHFDEGLSSVTTGKFSVKNWREAPVNG
jgi:hypothetical protein